MGGSWSPDDPDGLGPDRRARIRRRVLSRIRPQPPTVLDRAYDALALLGRPAPFIVRAAMGALLFATAVATATVASAEALPDEPLYGLKVAGEEIRLALAQTATDRAAIELSVAEHRLAEAEALARMGRADDAFVATSAYGAHLANAAAELLAAEPADAGTSSLADQLQRRLETQQRQAADAATDLGDDPSAAAAVPALRTVASHAPTASGSRVAEGIAAHAASVAVQVAQLAERGGRSDPQAARAVAERVKQEAQKAREAAEKAKQNAKRTPEAKPGR